MVAFTGILISGTEDALKAIHANDVKAFEDAFERLLGGYKKINRSMDSMWGRSKAGDYMKFRSFIFGTAPKKVRPVLAREYPLTTRTGQPHVPRRCHLQRCQ